MGYQSMHKKKLIPNTNIHVTVPCSEIRIFSIVSQDDITRDQYIYCKYIMTKTNIATIRTTTSKTTTIEITPTTTNAAAVLQLLITPVNKPKASMH